MSIIHKNRETSGKDEQNSIKGTNNGELPIQMQEIARMISNPAQLDPRMIIQMQKVYGNNRVNQFIQQAKEQQPGRSSGSTGLPDKLKQGVESLSNQSMDDVKVHYNSSKPGKLGAHAYTQGTQIHLAPGQEQHLPHEAWHVVQQKEGRVNATTSVGGAKVNDSPSLEHEADVMGNKALHNVSKETAGKAGIGSGSNSAAPITQFYKPSKKEQKKINDLKLRYITAKDPNDAAYYENEFNNIVEKMNSLQEIIDVVTQAEAKAAAIKERVESALAPPPPPSHPGQTQSSTSSSSSIAPPASVPKKPGKRNKFVPLVLPPSSSAPAPQAWSNNAKASQVLQSLKEAPSGSFTQSLAKETPVEKPRSRHQVINTAYELTDTGKGNQKNSGGEWELSVSQVKEIMAEWTAVHGGTAVEPQSRPYSSLNKGMIMIHLNFKQNSYHVFLKGTQEGGSKREAFLKEWPKAGNIVYH